MPNKWEERLLGLAAHVSEWSKDPSTGVGAVISDHHQRVVSLGYNGHPVGVQDDPVLFSRKEKLFRTVHAEANAILFAKADLSGMTIFCTHPPCSHCAALIIQSGISNVVYRKSEDSFSHRWSDSVTEAHQMFLEAGVEVRVVG